MLSFLKIKKIPKINAKVFEDLLEHIRIQSRYQNLDTKLWLHLNVFECLLGIAQDSFTADSIRVAAYTVMANIGTDNQIEVNYKEFFYSLMSELETITENLDQNGERDFELEEIQ